MLPSLIAKPAKEDFFSPFHKGRQTSAGKALEEKQVKASREQYFVRNTISPGTRQNSTVFISLLKLKYLVYMFIKSAAVRTRDSEGMGM